jgi:hypothetical protein
MVRSSLCLLAYRWDKCCSNDCGFYARCQIGLDLGVGLLAQESYRNTMGTVLLFFFTTFHRPLPSHSYFPSPTHILFLPCLKL